MSDSEHKHGSVWVAVGALFCFLGNGVAEAQWSPLPFEQLKPTQEMPAILTLESGRPVRNSDDWKRRRAEMTAMLEYYQYGHMPPAPDEVKVVVERRRRHASDLGHEEWVTLSIDSQHQLKMRAVVYVPDQDGPYPAVIREEGTLGRTQQVPLFLEKGYMFIEYARHDLDPDRKGVKGLAQLAYPEHDWETLSVWAWGGMRVVDYLQSRNDVDLDRIAITGHSRGGKMALLAGALDERFALVAPMGSGAGGAGSYRWLGPGAESLAMNDKPHWYHSRIRDFAEKEEYLPFDQHFLKALVAPRALICIESVDDAFANPEGTQITSVLAQQAYRFLEADQRRNGLHYRNGPHESSTEDWQTLLAFAEWNFFGRPPENPERYWDTPFPQASSINPAASQADAATVTESKGPIKISMTLIAEPNNSADRNYFDQGQYGNVADPFRIGTRQITNQEYCEFLNAVASHDPHSLFDERMQTDDRGGISRSGGPGEYRYAVKPEMQQQPVVFVSWFDAARFCNWLHNALASSAKTAAVTESGAYELSGEGKGKRQTGARVFLPSENEWYKAVYYSPGDATYQLFEGNDNRWRVQKHPADWVSPWGIQESMDHVWEWTDTPVSALFRGLRSGAWFQGNNRQAAGRFYSNPEWSLGHIGFRIAAPE